MRFGSRWGTRFFGGAGTVIPSGPGPGDTTGSFAGTAAKVPFPWACAIGGHPYMIDTKQYDRARARQLRPSYDASNEPGEQTLATEGVWKRSQGDFSYGTGQELYDEQSSDRRRFRASKGLDPWTVRQVSMLKDTTKVYASSGTTGQLLHAGSYLYWLDGSTLRFSQTPDAPGSFSTVGSIGTAQCITTDGDHVYIASGTDIYKANVGSTTGASLSTEDANYIAFANGHLIACAGNVVKEISAAGALVGGAALMTHFNSSFSWVACCGSPGGIFLAGNNGSTGEFYFTTYDPNTGVLGVPTPAGSLPAGEQIRAMAYYGGALLLATSKGLRLGTLVGSGNSGVAEGPLIDTGDCRCVEAQGEFVWFGWTNYDSISTGLGRAKLSVNTFAQTPAYASDLMSPSGESVQGTVNAVATFNGRRYFTVSGYGLVAEHATNLVPSASLDTGWITFSTFEAKVVSSVDFRHDPLHGTVTAFLDDETGVAHGLGVSQQQTTTGPLSPLGGQNLAGERFKLRFLFTVDDTDPTAGPVLHHWSMRVLVSALQIDEIVVPVILKETISLGSQEAAMDPLGEWLFLKGLESSRQVIQYQEGTQFYPVTVRDVHLPAGGASSWTKKRTFFNATVFVTLQTVQ